MRLPRRPVRWVAVPFVAVLLSVTANPAEARPKEYLASINGAYTWSGTSEWKRYDTATCDITDITNATYEAQFFSPVPVVIDVDVADPDLFNPVEMPIRVLQKGVSQDIYDHEPETSPCGEDFAEEKVKCTKSANTSVSLFADTDVVPSNGTPDDFAAAPDILTVTSSLPTRKECFPFLGPWNRNYWARTFLPATAGPQKTTELVNRRTKEVVLRGKRQMLESGTAGADDTGLWHTGWSLRWRLTLIKN